MATPPSGDGIFVPLQLDTSEAVKQFEQFGQTVKKTDLRPNAALDEFFGGVASNVSEAGARVRKFQMDMKAMSAVAKATGYSFDSSKAREALSKPNVKMDVRALAAVSARPGTMNMAALATAAAKKTLAEQRIDKYGKIGGGAMNLASAAQPYVERAGSVVGRAGGYAVGTGSAIVASGFSGTVEGERAARELRVLSLELAASFRPLIESFTIGTRRVREWAQSLTPEGQDRVQTAGATVAGAYLGYRLGGAKGAVVGGALGFAGSEMAIQEAKDQQQKDKEFQRDKSMLEKTPEERLVEVKKRKKEIADDFDKEYSFWSFNHEANDKRINRLQVVREIEKNANREIEINRKKAAGIPLSEDEEEAYKNSKSNPNRRQLRITEGAGFAGVGDTFKAIQEDALRTTTDQVEELKNVVQAVNDVRDEVKRLGK